jgi:hypothetical protein
MQIIENFRTLMSVDHIAWADGPGWLLTTILVGVFMGIVVGTAPRRY